MQPHPHFPSKRGCPQDVQWDDAVNVSEPQWDNEEGAKESEEGRSQTGASHSKDTGQQLAPFCLETAVVYLKGKEVHRESHCKHVGWLEGSTQ